MIFKGVLNGRYVSLMSVSEDDAEFTSRLRSDDNLTEHIHAVDTSIEGQKNSLDISTKKKEITALRSPHCRMNH